MMRLKQKQITFLTKDKLNGTITDTLDILFLWCKTKL